MDSPVSMSKYIVKDRRLIFAVIIVVVMIFMIIAHVYTYRLVVDRKGSVKTNLILSSISTISSFTILGLLLVATTKGSWRSS
jgi:hypothetical protein